MEVPRTSSGKPCKLCLAKGGPCHLHGGSPKKSSPKTLKRSRGGSSPKRSSGGSPNDFERLADLPIPALQQVLLNLDRSELARFCNRNNPKIQRICRAPEFKRLYNLKHTEPNVVIGKFGKLQIIPHQFGARSDINAVMKDENGNELLLVYRDDGRIQSADFRRTFTSTTIKGLHPSIQIIIRQVVSRCVTNFIPRGASIDKIFELLKTKEWMARKERDSLSSNDRTLAMEIWKIFQSRMPDSIAKKLWFCEK